VVVGPPRARFVEGCDRCSEPVAEEQPAAPCAVGWQLSASREVVDRSPQTPTGRWRFPSSSIAPMTSSPRRTGYPRPTPRSTSQCGGTAPPPRCSTAPTDFPR